MQLDNFQQSLKLRGLSINTIEAYSDANRKFLKFIQKPPKYITKEDVKTYINHLIDTYHKPKSINLTIAALKAFYDDFLGRRLFTKIKRLKLEKNIPNVLSKQEIKELIKVTLNPKHKLIIKFLYSTGVRVGELINVKIEDLDLINGFVRIIYGKGKKSRLTIISKDLCKEITEFIKDNQIYLFPSNRGDRLTIRSIQQIIKNSSKKAMIKRRIYPHAMRASFATHLYDKGIQLQKIQKLMGHSDFKTTLGYTKSATVDISDIENPLDNLT